MGYLPVIDEDQATGKLKEIYDYIRIVRKQKQVSPVLKALSMKPELLDQVVRISDLATFGGTTLDRRWEEMLSTAASTWNGCHYWLVSHGEFLRAVTRDHALVAALQKDDWTLATLEDKDRALLHFARKLNDKPNEISMADVEGLRSAGFADQNIFDVVVILAYFNFMNRIVDGLGVVPKPEKLESHERHIREMLASKTSAATPNG